MQLRDYQERIADDAAGRLQCLGLVYLAMEVRTGKTITAMETVKRAGMKSVLFVTKLSAIQSVEADYAHYRDAFSLTVINFENLHKVKGSFDAAIVDEAHSLGAYPKPSLRTKRLRGLLANSSVILMSGTPNPEGYSQLYHQFWVAGKYSPFTETNFYKWAKTYVIPKERMFNGVRVVDYSNAMEWKVKCAVERYFIRFSQTEAGFEQEVTEEIIRVPAGRQVDIIRQLLKVRLYRFQDGEVLTDTAAKQLNKLHQLWSGTVKDESGQGRTIDVTKAKYIRDNYGGKKIAIYYVFIAEGSILRRAFPNHTTDPAHFNATGPETVFISQIQSGSMGVNLSSADYIIFYNIHHSSLLYWQARARMQSMERKKESIVHWLFTEGGIEEKIYDKVLQKKNYTTYYFRKDYLNDRAAAPDQTNKPPQKQGGLRREVGRLQ